MIFVSCKKLEAETAKRRKVCFSWLFGDTHVFSVGGPLSPSVSFLNRVGKHFHKWVLSMGEKYSSRFRFLLERPSALGLSGRKPTIRNMV